MLNRILWLLASPILLFTVYVGLAIAGHHSFILLGGVIGIAIFSISRVLEEDSASQDS